MRTLQRRFELFRRCALGVLLVVPLFFAQGAQPQAALVYDESTDGDLPSATTLMFSADLASRLRRFNGPLVSSLAVPPKGGSVNTRTVTSPALFEGFQR